MEPTNTPNNDHRNVVDVYKYWSTEAIKADLDTKRLNYSVLAYNLGYDYNVSTVVRNSNAFLAKNVYIWPKRKFDKRGAVGTTHYTDLKHVTQLESIESLHPDAIWIAMDNVPGAIAIDEFVWPTDKHIILCFGQESTGLPQEVLDNCHYTLYIKQYGSVRSLNVCTASGIAMHEIAKHLGCG